MHWILQLHFEKILKFKPIFFEVMLKNGHKDPPSQRQMMTVNHFFLHLIHSLALNAIDREPLNYMYSCNSQLWQLWITRIWPCSSLVLCPNAMWKSCTRSFFSTHNDYCRFMTHASSMHNWLTSVKLSRNADFHRFQNEHGEGRENPTHHTHH